MNDFVIIGDASCDLDANVREKWGIEYLPAHVIFPDNSEAAASLDWADFRYVEGCDAEKFYRALKKCPDGFKTSPANPTEWEKCLEACVCAGKDVLVVCISQNLSGAYDFIVKAREQVLRRHPGARIFCIDSMRFSAAVGLLLIEAAIQRQNGKSAEETAAFLEKHKNSLHQMGWMDDMSFLMKKGRISPVKSFFATVAGVKVFGEFDHGGRTTPIGKTANEKRAFAAILKYIEATVENAGEQTIFVMQTGRRPQAEILAQMIRDSISPREVVVGDIYPYSGINIGPGLMAAYYFGSEISDDLSVEKSLMEKILDEV